MLKFSKTIGNALAIMGQLAEAYSDHHQLRSSEIAEQCQLSQPLVSKLMTRLSNAGLVSGNPGPGGGYRLRRPPEQIDLASIIQLFRRLDEPVDCPFGSSCCQSDEPCEIHRKIQTLVAQLIQLLEQTTLERNNQSPV